MPVISPSASSKDFGVCILSHVWSLDIVPPRTFTEMFFCVLGIAARGADLLLLKVEILVRRAAQGLHFHSAA